MFSRFSDWIQRKTLEVSSPIVSKVTEIGSPLISKVINTSSTHFLYLTNVIQTVTPASSTRKATYEYVIQGLEGYIQALSLSNITNTLRIISARNSFIEVTLVNLLIYAGLIKLTDQCIEEIHPYLPKDDLYHINDTIDMLAGMVLLSIMVRACINTTSKCQSISKAIVDTRGERPVYYQKDHAVSLNIQAMIASPIHYLGKMITIDIISRLPYLKYLKFPLLMIAYGQCFIEYNIAADGMGSIQRNQILADNNAFAFGMGLSFQCALWGGNYVIRHTMGLQNYFTEDAIFSWMFSYYIIVAQLMGKLPGKQGGLDIFYPSRLVTEVLMKSMFEKVVQLVKKYSLKEDVVEKIKKIIYSKPFLLIEKIILWQKIESLNLIEKIPEVKMLLTVYEKNIREAIIEISSIRMMPFLGKALTASNYITPIIPNFILSERQLLKIIFNKNTSRILTEMKKFMIRSRLNKLDKIFGCLLTPNDKNHISACIDIQVSRLMEGVNDPEEDPEFFLQKTNALYDLYYSLFKPGAETAILNIINEWKKDYYDVINLHRNAVSQWIKLSETAIFADELSQFVMKAKEDNELDEIEIREEVVRLTFKRIKELQSQSEKMPGNYLTREKRNALIELDELIDDYYEKIPLRQIVLIWKEYNWHVINAHRNVSSKLIRGVSGLIRIEKSETSTAEFITTLLDDYGRLTPKRIDLDKTGDLFFSSPSNKPDMLVSSVESINPEICQLIKNKIRSLLTEKNNNLKNKINALQDLIDKVKNANNVTFGDLLKEWKSIYWQNITEHRPITSLSTSLGVVSGLISGVLGGNKLTQTTTASFIDSLEKTYGYMVLSNEEVNDSHLRIKNN